MATLASMLGAIILLAVITIGLIKLLSRWNDNLPGILTANALSLFIATILASFGFSDTNEPVFGEAFSIYIVPQLLVLAGTFWRWSRRKPNGLA